jgi:hypothetical protein
MKTCFSIFVFVTLFFIAFKNADKNVSEVKKDTVSSEEAVNTNVVKDTIPPVLLDTACVTGVFHHKSEAALLVNPRRIVLNKDGTGQDIYTEVDKRPITWTLKDGKLFFHAAKDPKGSPGKEIYINCKTNIINYNGDNFAKK